MERRVAKLRAWISFRLTPSAYTGLVPFFSGTRIPLSICHSRMLGSIPIASRDQRRNHWIRKGRDRHGGVRRFRVSPERPSGKPPKLKLTIVCLESGGNIAAAMVIKLLEMPDDQKLPLPIALFMPYPVSPMFCDCDMSLTPFHFLTRMFHSASTSTFRHGCLPSTSGSYDKSLKPTSEALSNTKIT